MCGSPSRKTIISIAALCALVGFNSAGTTGPSFESQFDSLIRELNQGSSQAFSDAIDTRAILSRTFDGLEVKPGLRAQFSDTINNGAHQMGEHILKGIPEGSYGKVVKFRVDRDKGSALVRYGDFDRGYRYHDYVLEKDDAGKVRIVDWFDYHEGFTYSFQLRQSVVTFDPTAAAARGLVPAFEGSDEDFGKLAGLVAAFRKKDFEKFYSVSATLPRELRRSRYVTLLTCQVSRMSRDQNLYAEAYRDLANWFGDDPTVALILLNYYFSRGDLEEVATSLRLLQESFGARDAAVLTLLSRTALGLRKVNEAAVLADEAIMIEPKLEGSYWAAINAHVALQNYTFAVMTAKSLEEQFGKSLDAEQFEKNGRYANFVKSRQYKEWQAGK